MAKFCLKKTSKRMPARTRYKIEKKVREHNRKMKKEAKKHPKKKSKQVMQVPNQCPFKEDILKEVEAMRKQHEEEKQKLREAAREKKRQKLAGGLEDLVSQAQTKQNLHTRDSSTSEANNVDNSKKQAGQQENSLKAYYKEFKKVLDAADVILEIVDARDPLGTRCKQVEEAVRSAGGNKRLVIVLNKADLVPRENLDQWLKYLRASVPAVALKSSTQNQTKRLGNRKLAKKKEDLIQGGTSFGAELILSLLGNYCRNSGTVKSSITVGVVGLPNVGKSSVINSLKRSKACNVGNTPGVTKTMQPVQLDSKIKLLDSPGIVFAGKKSADNVEEDDSSIALKNAVRIQSLRDPYGPATAILRRVSKQQIMELYDMHEFLTPEEFFAKKAARMGKFKKGGVPDALAAARSLLEDWSSGKIRYYTVPPEQPMSQLSAEIVSTMAKEFDIESFAAEEKMVLDSVAAASVAASDPDFPTPDPIILESSGPVDSAMEVEDKAAEYKVATAAKKKKDKKPGQQVNQEARKKKSEPLFEIEGNQKLNKLNKLQFKKQKKERVRREKEATKLAGQLEEFNLTSEDYDFTTDFTPK